MIPAEPTDWEALPLSGARPLVAPGRDRPRIAGRASRRRLSHAAANQPATKPPPLLRICF